VATVSTNSTTCSTLKYLLRLSMSFVAVHLRRPGRESFCEEERQTFFFDKHLR
jgi:hypothetical protein